MPQRIRHPSEPSQPIAAALLLFLMLVVSGCASQRIATPKEGLKLRGMASWYGPNFHGKPTAGGETYDMHGLTAAHKELPLDTQIEVTNLDNGKKVRVRVNDRGPYIRGRILDLSFGAAKKLGMVEAGLARVEIRVLEVGGGKTGDLYAKAFAVQVGAFSQAENARRLLADLEFLKAESEIVRDGDLHRVRIGPVDTRKEAEKLRERLSRRGFDGLVVTIPRQ